MVIIGYGLHGKNITETIISASFVFLFLWICFSYILFHRFRFDNGIIKFRSPRYQKSEIMDSFSNSGIDIPDLSIDLGHHDGCVGIILALIGSIIGIFILLFLLYIGFEIGSILFLLIAIPLYWIFRLSARLVYVNARKCNGNLGVSVVTALKYALMYSMVIGLVFYGVNAVLMR